jgi:hypothetical protein
MTDKIDTNQEAREAIAKIISNSGYHQNEYTKANSILSLKGDGWKVGIIDTKAEWIDQPDKSGDYWMSSFIDGQYQSPHIKHVLNFNRPDRGLEVEYNTGARSSVPVKEFCTEYHPKAKWLFIPEPDIEVLNNTYVIER